MHRAIVWEKRRRYVFTLNVVVAHDEVNSIVCRGSVLLTHVNEAYSTIETDTLPLARSRAHVSNGCLIPGVFSGRKRVAIHGKCQRPLGDVLIVIFITLMQ